MQREMRQLYGLLEKAKAERVEMRKKHQMCTKQLDVQIKKNEAIQAQYDIDREIFAKMIQDDREKFSRETIGLRNLVEGYETQHEGLIHLCVTRQNTYLNDIRKLTRSLLKIKNTCADQVRSASELDTCLINIDVASLDS